MFLLDSTQPSTEVVAAILSAAGVLLGAAISIIIFLLSGRNDRKGRLINKFGETYEKAFSIKNEIEKTCYYALADKTFNFELDYILNDEDIQTKILDYLTETENYFSVVVGKCTLDRNFKKLSSFALYSRWTALYGYVIKARLNMQNKKMFTNFVKVIDKMEKMDKVKNKITFPENFYYVGIRQSDCFHKINLKRIKFAGVLKNKKSNKSSELLHFDKSIDMFPGEKAPFPVRPNQNIGGKIFLPYIEKRITAIIDNKKNRKTKNIPQFMFYNPIIAYRLPARLRPYFLCLNDKVLLNKINDKITCRTWLLNNGVNIITFKSMSGSEIIKGTYKDIGNTDQIIIQSNNGGGGIGTFLCREDNFEQIKSRLVHTQQYIVSTYIKNSISVNTHVFISDKHTVLSPASVQIIENTDSQLCYRGADYIAFKDINKRSKDEIRIVSIKIANLLRDSGYRGVAGLDFIIAQDGKVYCSEINPRFQASSVLLDLYLEKNKQNGLAGSVYQLNFQAFNNAIKSDLCFDDEINFSCYYYYDDGKPEKYYAEKIKLFDKNIFRLDLDGYSSENTKTDRNSYLFRAIFDHQICAVSPDNTLWINDNITISDKPKDLLQLKVALLNQGVRMENEPADIKKGVYESVDISFCGELSGRKPLDINCATNINLAKFSPYVLDCKDNQLKYFGEPLGEFEIERDLPPKISGISRKILYISADRVRIKMISGCEYKNTGAGCEFCDVPHSENKFSSEEIRHALIQLKNSNLQFRHMLIGGGTCLSQNIWEEIISLVKWLKSDNYFKDKPISLMSILPPQGEGKDSVLFRLKEAGIDEVAFNLEVADESLAKKLMPGKYKGKELFYSVMQSAVNIFGINSVRSALIVGLDKKEDIVREVCSMAEHGIMPCLSALRALRGAKANIKINPSNEYLIDVYKQCKDALEGHKYAITQLGPPCQHCRNNMLSL